MARRIALLFCFALLLVLPSCFQRAGTNFSRASYLDGKVVVDLTRDRVGDNKNYLSVTFYEKGTYEITFSIPGSDDQPSNLPESITKDIVVGPREHIFVYDSVPANLRIKISLKGDSEFHDF